MAKFTIPKLLLVLVAATSVSAAATTTFPKSSGAVASATAIPVSGTFDGGMKKYERNPDTCKDQSETDEAAAMFILENGATIQNVILGAKQAEGIHCRGSWYDFPRSKHSVAER